MSTKSHGGISVPGLPPKTGGHFVTTSDQAPIFAIN
jgi:hypothetical protein